MSCTVSDCQKRWKTLRERLVKEIKKTNSSSGDAATSAVVWELFPHMKFLKEFVKHRKYV